MVLTTALSKRSLRQLFFQKILDMHEEARNKDAH